MGRFSRKIENTTPPEREPTEAELDEIDNEEPSECDEPGARDGESEVVPTESERAIELRRRYGWG
jgi:hypothetical protein